MLQHVIPSHVHTAQSLQAPQQPPPRSQLMAMSVGIGALSVHPSQEPQTGIRTALSSPSGPTQRVRRPASQQKAPYPQGASSLISPQAALVAKSGMTTPNAGHGLASRLISVTPHMPDAQFSGSTPNLLTQLPDQGLSGGKEIDIQSTPVKLDVDMSPGVDAVGATECNRSDSPTKVCEDGTTRKVVTASSASQSKGGTGEPLSPTASGSGDALDSCGAEQGDSGGTGALDRQGSEVATPLDSNARSTSARTTGRSSASVAGKLYRVSYTFSVNDEESSQLPLVAGDIVRVQCYDPSGWTYGRLECTSGSGGSSGQSNRVGSAGWFPEALLADDDVAEPALQGQEPQQTQSATFPRSGPQGSTGGSIDARQQKQQQKQQRREQHREQHREAQVPSLGRPQGCHSEGRKDFAMDSEIDVTELGLGLPEEDSEGWGGGLDENASAKHHAFSLAPRRRHEGTPTQSSVNSTSEAEANLEMAERTLVSLEEQDRRCKAEIAGADSSGNSGNVQQVLEARLKLLEAKKQVAAINLVAARERVESERISLVMAKQKRCSKAQGASVEVEGGSNRPRARRAAIIPAQQPDHQDQQQEQLQQQPSRSRQSKQHPASMNRGLVGTSASPAAGSNSAASTASSRNKQRTATAGSAALASPGSRAASLSPTCPHRWSGAPPPAATARAASPHRNVRVPSSPGRSTVAAVGQPSLCLASRPPWGGGAKTSAVANAASPQHSGQCLARGLGNQTRSPRPPSPQRRVVGSSSQVSLRDARGHSTPSRVRSGPERPKSCMRGRTEECSPEVCESPTPWLAGATAEELTCAFDALESAEALQAKLNAMPAHVRAPILQRCPGLRGLLGGGSEPFES